MFMSSWWCHLSLGWLRVVQIIYRRFTEDAHKQWTGHWEECESHWAMALKNENVCKDWSGSSFRLALKPRSNHSCFDVWKGLFHNIYI